MKLLVNTSNLVIGGGIQVGVWFIKKCIEKKVDAHFAVSARIMQELKTSELLIDESRMRVFVDSPSRSKQARLTLVEYESQVMPDIVFTVFGPSYVKFANLHLCGFADGWLSHSTHLVYKKVYKGNWLAAAKLFASSLYKAYKIRQADAWVFEAEVAADGLAKRAGLNRGRCFVIPNNCAEHFMSTPVSSADENRRNLLRILYFTADYPHKGIKNYLSYAKYLSERAPELEFVFVITISKTSSTAKEILTEAEKLGIENRFDFTGYVSIDKAVELIDSVNIVMQTSYLETFSANYPEAMARCRPLVVSDFKFARDICHDAALYVDPENPPEVVGSIMQLIEDPKFAEEMVNKGRRVLSSLPTSEERFATYMKIMNQLVKETST